MSALFGNETIELVDRFGKEVRSFDAILSTHLTQMQEGKPLRPELVYEMYKSADNVYLSAISVGRRFPSFVQESKWNTISYLPNLFLERFFNLKSGIGFYNSSDPRVKQIIMKYQGRTFEGDVFDVGNGWEVKSENPLEKLRRLRRNMLRTLDNKIDSLLENLGAEREKSDSSGISERVQNEIMSNIEDFAEAMNSKGVTKGSARLFLMLTVTSGYDLIEAMRSSNIRPDKIKEVVDGLKDYYEAYKVNLRDMQVLKALGRNQRVYDNL